MKGAFENKKDEGGPRRIAAVFMMALGILLLLSSLWFIMWAVSSQPIILRRPDAAVERADEMMAAVCKEDYDAVSTMLYGCPNLGTCPEDSRPAVDLLWDAFLESLEYDFPGDCYVDNSGVAIDVAIRYLDVPGVLEGLDSLVQECLNRRISEAEDILEIYDERNDYRQEMITAILCEATAQALKENSTYLEQTIQLHMVYKQGQWWVVPEEALLNVFSGAFTR